MVAVVGAVVASDSAEGEVVGSAGFAATSSGTDTNTTLFLESPRDMPVASAAFSSVTTWPSASRTTGVTVASSQVTAAVSAFTVRRESL